MIVIKCIETEDVYELSGDDETFNVKIYSNLAAALSGCLKTALLHLVNGLEESE